MKKRLLYVVLWICALCAGLMLCDRLLMRDDSERKYGAFYDEKQDFDVLFMGTSRVLDAVSPLEMWRDYGFTSYNMGNNSEPLEHTLYVMEAAFEYHVPKVAVVDLFYISHSIDEAWAYPYRHIFLDRLPMSRTKIDLVKKSLPEDLWLEYLMPFSLYHGRWEELLGGTSERMIDCEAYMMGGELRIGRSVGTQLVITREKTQEELPGHEQIRRITQLCREYGVVPVFIVLPGFATETEQMNMNSAEDICKELGVPYVNMMYEGLLDFENDCFDWVGHLNPDGASKASAFLGRYLTEHYALPDHRGDAAYAHCDENLKLYEAEREAKWESWKKEQAAAQ